MYWVTTKEILFTCEGMLFFRKDNVQYEDELVFDIYKYI